MAVPDVLQRLQKVRRSGSGYVASCPAHEDREPSLSITLGGTGAVLLNCHAGCTFERITSALGIEARDLMPESSLRKDDHLGAETFSRRRENLKLTSTYAYKSVTGEVVARKLRYTDATGSKTFRWERPDPSNPEAWIPGGNDAPLYRLPQIISATADSIVVIVEGEKDADRLASLGYAVTTTPNGAGTKWRDADSQFFAGRRVCVIADDDEPGRAKAKNIAEALSGIAAAVGVVTLPNPKAIKGFDSSDFLDQGGTPERLRQIIEGFDTPRMPAEVADAAIVDQRVVDLYRAGGATAGVFPGWRVLAPLFRPKVGQLIPVTGAPNAGKSNFIDDLIIRTSCSDGDECARWKWVTFSAEHFPIERHFSQLLQKLIGKPFGDGPSARMTEREARAGLEVLHDFITPLDPVFSGLHVDRILEVTAELNARSKRHALLIDPFNVLAATSRAKGESEHDFINTLLAKLRTFAQAEQMAVFIVAHPTKLRRDEGADEYPVVRPWDISGSAHWFNHADAILSVWRAMKCEQRAASGEVEIHVSKVRFQPECGTLGMARLYFDRVTTRYHEQPRVTVTGAHDHDDFKVFAAEGRRS